jgi:hypothetical protein
VGLTRRNALATSPGFSILLDVRYHDDRVAAALSERSTPDYRRAQPGHRDTHRDERGYQCSPLAALISGLLARHVHHRMVGAPVRAWDIGARASRWCGGVMTEKTLPGLLRPSTRRCWELADQPPATPPKYLRSADHARAGHIQYPGGRMIRLPRTALAKPQGRPPPSVIVCCSQPWSRSRSSNRPTRSRILSTSFGSVLDTSTPRTGSWSTMSKVGPGRTRFLRLVVGLTRRVRWTALIGGTGASLVCRERL